MTSTLHEHHRSAFCARSKPAQAVLAGQLERVTAIMFVVLIPFLALKELARTIGDDNLYELFFVRKKQVYAAAAILVITS
jgi:hypothetical protein